MRPPRPPLQAAAEGIWPLVGAAPGRGARRCRCPVCLALPARPEDRPRRTQILVREQGSHVRSQGRRRSRALHGAARERDCHLRRRKALDPGAGACAGLSEAPERPCTERSLDNLNTHKPSNDRWLKLHPNVQFHFTPTRASWLNQVEIWFSILQAKPSPRSNSLESTSMPSSRLTTSTPSRSSGPSPRSIKSVSKPVLRINDSGY